MDYRAFRARLVLASVLLACASTAAKAGAWQHESHHWLTIETAEFYRAEAAGRSFEQLTTRSYTEWAAAPGLTFGGKIGHAWQISESATDVTAASGVNEAHLFAMRHWQPGKGWVAAARLSGHFATSKFARDVRVMGQDAAIGAAALAGWSNGRTFVEFDAEQRLSLGKDADQFRLQTTLGQNAGPFLFLAQTAVTESLSRTARGGIDYDLVQFSLSAVLPLTEGLSLELGGRDDLSGEGLDTGSSLFFSLWWRT